MNIKKQFDLRENYSKNLKEFLILRIDQLGHFDFSDDSWYLEKRHKDSLPKGAYTLTFYQIPIQYKNWVKYYALLCDNQVNTINKKCLSIARFFKFIVKQFGYLELGEITRQHINAFEYSLNLSSYSMNNKQVTYASVHDFFTKISDFDENLNNIPSKRINPFKQSRYKKDNLISSEDLKIWDTLLKDEQLNIPLEFRTLYWLIRSFPNRITEVLSMKRDCLKSFYSEYVIQFPTFKQSGGYGKPVIKSIPVVYQGHGKYVIDLIKKLQEQTNLNLSKYPIGQKQKHDYLFLIRRWNFYDDNGLNFRFNQKFTNQLYNWTGPKINDLLKQMGLIMNIRNKHNQLIIPTTHHFRHSAVTERLYTVGYTIEQVRRLTGHKNESMTKFYTHQLVEKHKKIHLGISQLSKPHQSAVEFKGKILNLDERTTHQLSKDPRRYLTWEANGKKGVGICSDISGCNPQGTSVHFECYACDWFVPKIEYLSDYRAEYAYWEKVINRTSGDSRRAAHFENAVRNLSYLERIISICENGVAHFKEKLVLNKAKKDLEPYNWE